MNCFGEEDDPDYMGDWDAYVGVDVDTGNAE